MKDIIENPQRRVVEELKERNKENKKGIASEYFGGKYSYEDTFKMFDIYKKGFISLDGKNEKPIVISVPSTVASVNAFYGAIDSNKVAIPTNPGFLTAFTDKFTKDVGAETVFILDSFLNEALINNLSKSGVKNVIITSISDYMHPYVKEMGIKAGSISNKDFLDEYIKSGKKLPQGMQFLRLDDFVKEGSRIQENIEFPYEKDKIAAYFLTGGTTSRIPKGVKIYGDGLNKMAQIYDKTWFDFNFGDKQALFIPLFYGTGAIHGVHAGLFSGMTLDYKPKYDRFAFGKDLQDSKAKIALVAPSHMATLGESNLLDKSLSHVKYIFLGGEAMAPAQMKKYRLAAERLGIQYVLNGYGMTETACMTGISEKDVSLEDVTVTPVPGVEYRIVDRETKEVLGENERGILEVNSPCKMAGYTNSELDKDRFTEDGWINTGDIAECYGENKYRVFGRETDCFTNNGVTYDMFDIEEEVLKHPGIAEAEVIKFEVAGQEYPAIVIVLNKDWQNKMKEVLNFISNINVPGIEYLIGTRFIDKFKTNPITAKRDYLSLSEDKNGYYRLSSNIITQTDLTDLGEFNSYYICDKDLTIFKDEQLTRELKK